MSLDTATLTSSIKTAFTSMMGKKDGKPDTAAETAAGTIATALANAIEAYVKSGTVKVTAGTGKIAVEGSAAKQANTAPITIEGAVE